MLGRPIAAAVVATAAAIAAVATGAPAARAESQQIDAITIGALAEQAEIVVVATATAAVDAAAVDEAGALPQGDSAVWTFRVDEAIRGGAKDQILRARVPFGRAPVAKGGRFLAFLRMSEGGAWVPVALPWALRTTAEAGTAALVDYTRGYTACLGADGRVARPGAFAEFLVASLGSDASGVPFSAGRDLVRHAEDVRAVVTGEQRDRVSAALAKPRRPDQDFVSIVLAAGRFGGAATDDLLVARLLDRQMRTERRHIVISLARRATADLVAKLAARIADADAPQRADLANALGRFDRREAEAPLLGLLRDVDPAVRVEAAHGLGLLARAVRELKPGADAAAPRPKLTDAIPPLVTAVAAATTENERRATTWALAQIDVPEAWDALRRLAKESPDLRVRALADRVLAAPRTALLLE